MVFIIFNKLLIKFLHKYKKTIFHHFINLNCLIYLEFVDHNLLLEIIYLVFDFLVNFDKYLKINVY